MYLKLKHTLFVSLFFAASISGIQAQDTFDLAYVRIDVNSSDVLVIRNGVDTRAIETDAGYQNFKKRAQVILTTVSEMTADGWEIIGVSNEGALIPSYHLKRKRK